MGDLKKTGEGTDSQTVTLQTAPPLVSVIVPTLNAIEFLEPRIRSLADLDYGSVEFLVVDSGSSDGTLERLAEWARADPRVRLIAAGKGLYLSLNTAIREAKGEFVYIATADDTCRPEILTRMVALLARHPDCDLCDSQLAEIDAQGNELTARDPNFISSFGHLCHPRDREHVRRAPYDFLQHCSGKTVYTSLTQILVRRTVFGRVGMFPEDWGNSADYLWGMRLAQACNVIYTPERLATWRVHDSQLTGHGKETRNYELMLKMGRHQIGTMPEGPLKRSAERLHRLVEMKSDLLPIKHHGSMREIVCGLLHAVLTHPVWLLQLAVLFAVGRWRGNRCAAVNAYDGVFRRIAAVELRTWGRSIEYADVRDGGFVSDQAGNNHVR